MSVRRTCAAIANVGAIQGGFGWRASRTPHRTDLFLDLRVPPDDAQMAAARAEGARVRCASAPRLGVEAEVYVTAPGAEIEEVAPARRRARGARTRRSSARRPSAT